MNNNALLLKQFPLFLEGIIFDWCCILHEIVTLTWVEMKRRFLGDQLTYWHNVKISKEYGYI